MSESILIFGGSELQLSILTKAKALGFRTIVLDPDSNALAKDYADIFLVVDANDYPKTIEIAKKYNISGIVTSSTDNPILMMCRIAAELNLPFPKFDSCLTVLDKGLFKEFLKKNNLPHAPGKTYSSADEIDFRNIVFPVIIKPSRNSGSRGVLKCENYDQLLNSINEISIYCKDGRFIIEKYLNGDEISVEALIYDNKVNIIQITDKITSPPPYNVELLHIQPSKYSIKINEITELLQKIVDLTGLNNCAIHPELKINNDNITIIEMGPRLGGDFITSHLVPLSTNIDIEELVIKLATNKKFDIIRNENAALISYLNFEIGSTVTGLLTKDKLIEKFSEVKVFVNHLEIGSKIPEITNSLNRYGHFIIQASNIQSLKSLLSEINNYIYSHIFKIN